MFASFFEKDVIVLKKQNRKTVIPQYRSIPQYRRSKKERRRDRMVMIFAYVHIYVLLPTVLWVPFLFGENWMAAFGISCLILACYEWLGSLCKWRHIYCSHQHWRRQSMTPDHIQWEKISKIDLYMLPIILSVAGIVICLFQ